MRRPSLTEIVLFFVIGASLYAVLTQLVLSGVENPPPSYQGYTRLIDTAMWSLGVLVVASVAIVAGLVAYRALGRIR